MNIDGIEIEFQRKRIKNLHLKVNDDGNAAVSMPMRYSEKKAIEFVKENEDWIRKQIEKKIKSKIRYENGETIYIVGEPKTLWIILSNRTSATMTGNDIVLTVTDDEYELKVMALRKLESEIVKQIADELIPKWSSLTGLTPSSYKTRFMKTRWGTCNPESKKIWLNTELARKPFECIEYVILHEIVHLKYEDHGDDFRRMMSEYMPDWLERRKGLN